MSNGYVCQVAYVEGINQPCKGQIYARQCGKPGVGNCRFTLAFCDGHGGDQRVMELMREHMSAPHAKVIDRTSGTSYATPLPCTIAGCTLHIGPGTHFCVVHEAT